jgi:hypothetical protein
MNRRLLSFRSALQMVNGSRGWMPSSTSLLRTTSGTYMTCSSARVYMI